MASKWMKLKNKPPFNVNTMLLLTDGSVMCQDGGGSGPSAGDIGTPNWWKLTPDKFGNYQATAYYQTRDSIHFVTLSCPSRESFEFSLPAFDALVTSYEDLAKAATTESKPQ